MSADTTRPCPWCGEDAAAGAPACDHCGVALTLPTPRVAGEPAGPAPRLLGAFVDSVVTFALAAVVLGVAPGRDDPPVAIVWAALAGYEILGTGLWGRTVGKLVARTRVTDIDSGAVPGVPAAVVRWFVPSVPVLLGATWATADLLVLPWAAVVYAAILGPARRGLHDRVARTLVVHV